MVKPIVVDKKTYIISCLHCGGLMTCEEDDILDRYNVDDFVSSIRGICPICKHFMGHDESYFYADIVDVVGPVVKETK